MDAFLTFCIVAGITFFGSFIAVPVFLFFVELFGLYVVVQERQCVVYTLFGKVEAVIDEPGFHFLPFVLGLKAFIISFFGSTNTIDLRLDQQYLRSQPVNSEEGAPMGIGIWYEMYVSDPVAYLFRNTDPRGSLQANVSNATVRCLSNLKLSEMLENRHSMSQTVRDEVSEKSHEWGYKLGSVYIRKVHFRDGGMIRQIEEKVVNRLRQVTSAIRQHGANQVNLMTSTADRQAASAFAKAAAMRPQIVGAALQRISKDPEILAALFDILETQKLVENHSDIVLINRDGPEPVSITSQLIAGSSLASGPPVLQKKSGNASQQSARQHVAQTPPPPQLPDNLHMPPPYQG
ncbi:band 7 protein [Verrucomicrobia bacterium LW23]|nr:band 7 protein [Verrucomicrobia bacterium LW23]